MTPLNIEVVMQALGICLLAVVMFHITNFSRRLQRHEERTAEAMETLAELRGESTALQTRLVRIETQLDQLLSRRGI